MTHTTQISSQNDQILTALLQGDKITPIDALNRFGCFKLSGIIWDLRNKGYQISTNTINNRRKHYAEYFLVK